MVDDCIRLGTIRPTKSKIACTAKQRNNLQQQACSRLMKQCSCYNLNCCEHILLSAWMIFSCVSVVVCEFHVNLVNW